MFDDLAAGSVGGDFDRGWSIRDRAISEALGNAMGRPNESGERADSMESDEEFTRAAEDVTEMEREAWCTWMLVAGAIIGNVIRDGSELTANDVRAVLAAASDAIDEDEATARFGRDPRSCS